MNPRVGVLYDKDNLHLNTIASLKELNIAYELINIDCSDWLSNLCDLNIDGILLRSNPKSFLNLSYYNEIVYTIQNLLKIPTDPSFEEIYIYENKRMMYYWLSSKKYNHVPTWVFKDKNKALSFLDSYESERLVFKSATGSGGSGVRILGKKIAKILTRTIFTSKLTLNIGFIRMAPTRFKIKRPILNDIQYDYVIFQELLDIRHEWRILKIGNSYFGHQKIKKGMYHSGSSLVGWIAPPFELLHLVKQLCVDGNFNTMNVDIFETMSGEFFINELQTHFGSYHPSQMYLGEIPGRFVFQNNDWVFEPGFFNRFGSMLIRVESFLEKLSEQSESNE